MTGRFHRGASLALAVVTAATLSRVAQARDGHTCALVEAGYFTTDGMLDDWSRISAARVSGGPDASFQLRCAYDASRLYLSLDVRDDRLVRTRQARLTAEDHVSITLTGVGGRKVRVQLLPGALTARRKLVLGRRRIKGLSVADSLQPKGFSVEVSVPRTSIPGIGPRTPVIGVDVAFFDTDKATAYRIERVRRFKGYLHTEAGARTFKAFLATLHLSPRDIRFDRLANVDLAPGAERVIVAGRYVGVLSDSFSFMQLPVAAARDVVRVQLVDFDRDGRSFLVGQYRQYGGGGSRDIVAVWDSKPDGSFHPVTEFEVSKQLGDARLTSTWQLVPRASLRSRLRKEPRRGVDLLVFAQPAQGVDPDTWNEVPATDVQPILLPWSRETALVYVIDGNSAVPVAPDARKLARWKRRHQ